MFRINVCFTKYVENYEKKDLIFKNKRQKALEKNIGRKFIRVNTSKHYDEYYVIGRIQAFIIKFSDR